MKLFSRYREDELVRHYQDLIIKYDKRVMQLSNKIYKAIKYIEEFKSYIPEDNIPELLEILGVDKNEM